ncbi:MAG: hypothetical protein IJ779_12060, partial [Ruminococcus sp.]|nr:hypothetical protein [Ruminococcus sp.]
NAAYAVSYYRDGQGFDNSAFDIKTNKSWGWPNISGYSTSIFNGTSAPNVSATNAVKAVTDENWLNISYLNSIGFNAG